MKTIKKLLIITLCFAFIVTNTTVAPNYDINPCEHLYDKEETF